MSACLCVRNYGAKVQDRTQLVAQGLNAVKSQRQVEVQMLPCVTSSCASARNCFVFVAAAIPAGAVAASQLGTFPVLSQCLKLDAHTHALAHTHTNTHTHTHTHTSPPPPLCRFNAILSGSSSNKLALSKFRDYLVETQIDHYLDFYLDAKVFSTIRKSKIGAPALRDVAVKIFVTYFRKGAARRIQMETGLYKRIERVILDTRCVRHTYINDIDGSSTSNSDDSSRPTILMTHPLRFFFC